MRFVLVAATTRGGLSDEVSPVFGRAPTFTVVTVEDGEVKDVEVIPNPYQGAPSGAGVQAAQLVASRAPKAVFAGNFGPNVAGVLAQAGVELVPASGLTVKEAVKAYLNGALTPQPSPAFGPGPGRGGFGARAEDVQTLKDRILRLERELSEVKRKLKELGGE